MRLVNKNLFHLHLGWGRNKWSKMHIQWALTQSNKPKKKKGSLGQYEKNKIKIDSGLFKA
jgi:hypothetical protein